jgi:hypothetical protein
LINSASRTALAPIALPTPRDVTDDTCIRHRDEECVEVFVRSLYIFVAKYIIKFRHNLPLPAKRWKFSTGLVEITLFLEDVDLLAFETPFVIYVDLDYNVMAHAQKTSRVYS